jgi:HD superfamily phosphohydrolase
MKDKRAIGKENASVNKNDATPSLDHPNKKTRLSFDAKLEDVYAPGNFEPTATRLTDGNGKFRRDPLPKQKMQRTNDEVHDSITYPPVIYTLSDTLPFQRLRDLNQLGTADKAYINCAHNRFEHSFGVYHLAVEQCKCLRDKQPLLRDPIQGLTEKDMLCVSIAGLLHDLGHGPYSHTFERFLDMIKDYVKENPELQKEYEGYEPIPADWKHETMSLKLIDAILLSLGLAIDLDHLDQPLKQVGHGIDPLQMRVHDDSETLTEKEVVLTSRDFVFVKEAIYGKPIPSIYQHFGGGQTKSFVGRPWPIKEYLYGIVSNDVSGLDGDKLDYLARDESKATGDRVKPQRRILEESYVAKMECMDVENCVRCCSKDGTKGKHFTICYPRKMAPSILDNVFLKRHHLHTMIYKHHTVECANLMICDIFCYADPYLRLALNCDDDDDDDDDDDARSTDSSKKPPYKDLPLSRAMLDENAYLRLRDGAVLSMISNSTDPKLRKARKLVRRYQARDLYKMAAEQALDCDLNEYDRAIWGAKDDENDMDQASKKEVCEGLSEKRIEEEMLELADTLDWEYRSKDGQVLRLHKDDFMVKKTSMHCGQKTRNPLTRVRFLKEDGETMARRAKAFDNLPVATECEEVDYRYKIPKTFESRVLRVYVPDKERRDLASRVFFKWYNARKREEEHD